MERSRYTLDDWLIALVLFTLGTTAALLMVKHVMLGIPRLEDEITYLFQARILARGRLWAIPPTDSLFHTPFMVTINDHWIGKYSLGWPLLLAAGEALDAGRLVNPVLGGLLAALTYLLGRDLYDRQIGLLGGLLAITSPLYLIQSSTLMSHAASAFWFALLLWAWLRFDSAQQRGEAGRGWGVAAGVALGMLVVTRLFTAAIVVIPLGVLLAVRAFRARRAFGPFVRAYAPMGVAALLVILLLHPLYLWVVTGSPFTNLYTLVWEFDRVGFGPAFGPGGHTLHKAYVALRNDLPLWASDLFGWPHLSWVPLIPGLIFGIREARPHQKAWPWLLGTPFVLLVVLHMAYWVGARIYGPRYYYEAHVGLALLAALGLRGIVRMLVRPTSLADPPEPADDRRLAQPGTWPVYVLLAALVAANAAFYLPTRLAEWHAVYDVDVDAAGTLDALRESDEVLVFVRGTKWVMYAGLWHLNTPFFDGPTIIVHDVSPTANEAVRAVLPDRDVWYYKDGAFSRDPFPYTEE